MERMIFKQVQYMKHHSFFLRQDHDQVSYLNAQGLFNRSLLFCSKVKLLPNSHVSYYFPLCLPNSYEV
jgi:hypothetical protein